jgi:hypothetical protein
MAAIILAGVYAGIKLDEYVAWQVPVFTLLFSIIASALAIYVIIKGVLR